MALFIYILPLLVSNIGDFGDTVKGQAARGRGRGNQYNAAEYHNEAALLLIPFFNPVTIANMQFNYKTTALLAVDIQNDFCPAYTGKDGREYPMGALAVNRANEIIDLFNKMAEKVRQNGGKVLATQDWHPSDHISFAASHPDAKAGDIITVPVSENAIQDLFRNFPHLHDPVPDSIQQVLWPVHCVQNTQGAAFHDELNVQLIDFVFRKGHRKNIDSYSAFFENDRCTPTDLYGYLKEQSIDTLLIGGLATDYCVFYSVMDSLRLGFKTYVINDACMGIDIPAGSIKKAIAAMEERGAVFVSAADI